MVFGFWQQTGSQVRHRPAKLFLADAISGLNAGSHPSRIFDSLVAGIRLCCADVGMSVLRAVNSRSALVVRFTMVCAAPVGSPVDRKALSPLSAETAT